MPESKSLDSVHSLAAAHSLIRKGHYREALTSLTSLKRVPREFEDEYRVTIAELHLRTGQSSIAVNTCRSVLRNHFASRGILARCHIVLGTASRDEGRLEEAVEHFHRALSIATDVPSREAATWSYLRLMLALAEHTGPQAALALLPDLRRHIIQLGDGQAVAALHFFLAEIETRTRLVYNRCPGTPGSRTTPP